LDSSVTQSFTCTFRCRYGSVCTTQSHVTWPTSMCRRLLRTAVDGRPSPVSLCSLRGSPGALDSDVYRSAQLLNNLEPTTNGSSITRTNAVFIQAPAQDPLVCSSTRQCSLQLWVSCTVVRRCCDCTASSAPTTNVQTRLNSTPTNIIYGTLGMPEHFLPRDAMHARY